MKSKIIIIIIAVSVLGLCAVSCKKTAFLDDKTSSALDETATFSDSVNTMGFLTRMYEDLGFAFNSKRWEGGANTNQGTDDIEYSLNSPTRRAVALAVGGFSAVNFYQSDAYQLPWQNIRRANLLMYHLPTTPLSPAMQLRIRGEARFMRAYFYAYLIINFGGVPIIGDKVYGNSDIINVPRNTFAESVSYVVKELDTAASLLPNVNDAVKVNSNNPSAAGYDPGIDYGRATKGSCMGIKARLLLEAASPLFNGGQIAVATAAQKPLVGYPDYQVSRWQVAADAAKAVMDLAGKPYSLYTEPTPTTVHGRDSTPGWGFQQVFLKRVTPATGSQYNQEYLLVVNRPVMYGEYELQFNPPTRGGGGSANGPSQTLVDQFPMRNGKAITDPASGYDPNNPFLNRDPRFDYTIIYNGSTYYYTNTNKRDTVWTYTGPNDPTSGKPATAAGQTSDAYPVSWTGYYNRKMCDPYITGKYSQTERCWGLVRYAEILLSYAEAINETGQTSLAYAPLVELRTRAGVGIGDPLCGLKPNMSIDEMRTVIRTERHIELALEGDFRWNDMCRWKTGTTVMNANGGILRGTQVIRVGSVGRVFTYNITNSQRPLTHFFAEPEYLFPFPLSEIQKVPLLVQNPGW